jgi:hypothetical protein
MSPYSRDFCDALYGLTHSHLCIEPPSVLSNKEVRNQLRLNQLHRMRQEFLHQSQISMIECKQTILHIGIDEEGLGDEYGEEKEREKPKRQDHVRRKSSVGESVGAVNGSASALCTFGMRICSEWARLRLPSRIMRLVYGFFLTMREEYARWVRSARDCNTATMTRAPIVGFAWARLELVLEKLIGWLVCNVRGVPDGRGQ